MARTNAIEPTTLKILLIGDAGTKKTRLAATFPDPHFVDLDGGMLSCRDLDVHYVTIGEQVTVDPDFLAIYPKNAEKKAKQSMFLKAQDYIEHLANTLTKDQTLVIDSLTFYSECALNHVQKLENNKDMRQTYGGAQKLIAASFELIKHLPCNVIVTAHRALIEDADGNIQYVPKSAGRSFSIALPSYFDEVWRTSVTRVKNKDKSEGADKYLLAYSLETIKGLREQGKSRLNLPQIITEPSYEKIMSLATQPLTN